MNGQALAPFVRNDGRAALMYRRYQAGLSLADVAAEFGCSRQSVYDVFSKRGLRLRPRPTNRETVIYNGRSYTARNNGYFGATTGDRHMLHRRMWEDAHGPIPEGWDIHHLDGDKRNNALSNFECLPKAEHTRLYSPSCNQFKHNCERGDHDAHR